MFIQFIARPALSGRGLLALFLAASLMGWCHADPLAAKLSAIDIATKANGKLELGQNSDMPLYAEVDRSATLSQALRASLLAKGIEVTSDRNLAKAVLLVRGDVALRGGPVFYKGASMAIGDATEQSIKAAAVGGDPGPAAAGPSAVSLALEAGAVTSATSPFMRGLAAGRIAEVLGDLTGARGAFNKALTGDPRGICLSRCDEWKKVEQTAYVTAVLTRPDGERTVRVMAKANSETLAPEEVIAAALARAVDALEVPSEPK